MTQLLVAFVLFFAMVAIMTVGLWFGRKPIQGTCGGLNTMQGGSCSICGDDPAKCDSTTPTNALAQRLD